MSPRFRTGLIALRLFSGLLLLATLSSPTLRAQTTGSSVMGPPVGAAPGDDLPFESVTDMSSYLGQTPLRVWHRTRGVGEEQSETALGTHWAAPTDGGLIFFDGQFRVGNQDQEFSGNLGVGARWRNDDFFTGSPRILGASIWYDGEDTQLDNWFNQIGVSFERLGPLVDLRLNANIPLEDIKAGDDVTFIGDTVFTGNGLAQSTLAAADASLRVVDFEAAPRIFNLNAWFYAGGYQMDGQGVSEFGEKGGVRGYIMNDLAVDVGVHDDDLFGTTTVFQIIWTPGRVTASPSSWSHTIEDRMREQVYRNSYVAVTRTTIAGSEELTDANGDPFDIVHVASGAADGGDGTIENPFNELVDVNNNTKVGDIVLVHSTSVFTGESVTLKDSQRFLGEGNNEEHLVVTSQLGEIALPESAPGAGALAKPSINDAPGPAAIILAGGSVEVDTLPEIEVSNFTIDGGVRGIFSPTGVGDVNINRMMISDTTGDGIALTPLTETLANSTTRSRFTPTIDEITFANVGGDDINLNGATAQATISETILISDIESDNGEGVGIRLTDTQRAATITNFDWNGGSTGLGALLIDNTVTQGTVTMNGTNAITGGAATAFAISLEGGAATHTVTGTTINNMGGAAIIADGGTAGLNFTGRINQTANDASILAISGGHDGNMTFTELTANDGVINAAMGDGLQFDDADGVYTFNDKVLITGVAGAGATSAVNVMGDSSGVLTFTDAEFTNINGDAITFNGGTANMTLTGRVQQLLNAQSVLTVIGGHDGTLAFTEITANQGVINATMGDGLQFNNADGAYTFNDRVLLTGTTEGILVNGGSSGTFAFTDANNAITNPTAGGDAIVIQASDSVFTYNGAITTNAGSGRAVIIGGPMATDGNTGGTVTIGAAITSTDEGILVQNNTGGTNAFTGAVSLTTGAQDAVVIADNTAGSTSFNNLDIVSTSGDGFTVTNSTGHTVTVTGTDNTISTGTGVGINMNTATVGAGGVNFRRVSVSGGAGSTSAISLTDVAGAGAVAVGAGTTNPGDGGVITNTAASAVVINNANNVSLNRMNITGTAAGDAISAVDATTLALTNLNITGTAAGDAISIEDSTTATLSNLTITNTTGRGVFIDDTTAASLTTLTINNTTNGAAVEVSDSTTLTMNGVDVNIVNNANGVTLANNTNATLTNVDVDDVDGAFSGIEINHNNAAVSNVTVSQSDLTNIGGRGIDYNRSATATSRLTLTDNTISGTGLQGIGLDISGSADSNITINGTNDVDGGDDEALLVTTSGGAAKTVRINVTNNMFNNNSAQATASFQLNGAVTFNANVTDNTFQNSAGGAARAFFMETEIATTNARLNLNGNTGIAPNANAFLLTETAGDFDAVGDETEMEANNTGGVELVGTIDDIPGPVPLPQ